MGQLVVVLCNLSLRGLVLDSIFLACWKSIKELDLLSCVHFLNEFKGLTEIENFVLVTALNWLTGICVCNFKHAIVTSTSSLIGFGTNVNLHLELYLCRLELEEPGKAVKIANRWCSLHHILYGTAQAWWLRCRNNS
jgi:hypothetical protein